MEFALIDLFGGMTELFESQEQALLAADELLQRYRRQATINEWQDPEYMSGIMVMQVSHRVTSISSRSTVKQNSACGRWDYCIQATKPHAARGRLVAVKG